MKSKTTRDKQKTIDWSNMMDIRKIDVNQKEKYPDEYIIVFNKYQNYHWDTFYSYIKNSLEKRYRMFPYNNYKLFQCKCCYNSIIVQIDNKKRVNFVYVEKVEKNFHKINIENISYELNLNIFGTTNIIPSNNLYDYKEFINNNNIKIDRDINTVIDNIKYLNENYIYHIRKEEDDDCINEFVLSFININEFVYLNKTFYLEYKYTFSNNISILFCYIYDRCVVPILITYSIENNQSLHLIFNTLQIIYSQKENITFITNFNYKLLDTLDTIASQYLNHFKLFIDQTTIKIELEKILENYSILNKKDIIQIFSKWLQSYPKEGYKKQILESIKKSNEEHLKFFENFFDEMEKMFPSVDNYNEINDLYTIYYYSKFKENVLESKFTVKMVNVLFLLLKLLKIKHIIYSSLTLDKKQIKKLENILKENYELSKQIDCSKTMIEQEGNMIVIENKYYTYTNHINNTQICFCENFKLYTYCSHLIYLINREEESDISFFNINNFEEQKNLIISPTFFPSNKCIINEEIKLTNYDKKLSQQRLEKEEQIKQIEYDSTNDSEMINNYEVEPIIPKNKQSSDIDKEYNEEIIHQNETNHQLISITENEDTEKFNFLIKIMNLRTDYNNIILSIISSLNEKEINEMKVSSENEDLFIKIMIKFIELIIQKRNKKVLILNETRINNQIDLDQYHFILDIKYDQENEYYQLFLISPKSKYIYLIDTKYVSPTETISSNNILIKFNVSKQIVNKYKTRHVYTQEQLIVPTKKNLYSVIKIIMDLSLDFSTQQKSTAEYRDLINILATNDIIIDNEYHKLIINMMNDITTRILNYIKTNQI